MHRAMSTTVILSLSLGLAAASVVTLHAPNNFVGSDGFPLPTGYLCDDASITTNAPFGVAIRSGSPKTSTFAAVEVPLTMGVTVNAITFSYRQCTGYGTTGLGPNFTLSIAGVPAFKSPAMHGYPYHKSCPNGGCYSPPVNVSLKSLDIHVTDKPNGYSDGVPRIVFKFQNSGSNLQLLLPMTLNLTCSGGPCTTTPPHPQPPNASAVNVACVGDSITEGYLSTNGADYPGQLQSMLGSGYKVSNFGASGRTMLKKGDDPYWRTGPLKQALASKPGIVVLMLGTNDAKFHNWRPLHDEFPIDYKAMIDEFSALTPRPVIYLMVPPPLYQNNRYGMNQTVINTLFPGDGPAGIRTLAKASGLPAPIDLFSAFQAHCPVEGGTPGHPPSGVDVPCDWIATSGRDACHPSNKGYGMLARFVKARIAP